MIKTTSTWGGFFLPFYPHKYQNNRICLRVMEKPEQTGTVRRSRLGHF